MDGKPRPWLNEIAFPYVHVYEPSASQPAALTEDVFYDRGYLVFGRKIKVPCNKSSRGLQSRGLDRKRDDRTLS